MLGEVLASGDAFFGQSWVREVLVLGGGFELVVALAVADEVDAWGHFDWREVVVFDVPHCFVVRMPQMLISKAASSRSGRLPQMMFNRCSVNVYRLEHVGQTRPSINNRSKPQTR